MQIEFKATNKFTVIASGATHTECFANLAGLAEIFSADKCGVCKSTEIFPIKRSVDGVNFYELKCKSCTARLSMGQNKVGGSLYPRKKYHKEHPDVRSKKVAWDKDNPPYLPNNGWEVYKGEARNDESEEAPTPKAKNGRR